MSRIALSIRKAHLEDTPESDLAYIRGSWCENLRHSSFSRHVLKELYWPAQHQLCDRLLELGRSAVAHSPDNDNHLYGCIVWQPAELHIVHWMHVKPEFRRMGVCDSLLRHAFRDRPTTLICTQASNTTITTPELVRKLGLVYFHYALLGLVPAMEKLCPPQKSESSSPSAA